MTSTRTGRAAIRSIVNLQWDGHDVQASVFSPYFGVCTVLYVSGEDVPAEAEFRPSPFLRDNGDLSQVEDEWPDAEFAELFESGEINAADLAYWARVLGRAADLIPADQRY